MRGKKVYDLTGNMAIKHTIEEKMELWQSNFETWRLFNTVLHFDSQCGYVIDIQAIVYMREYEGIEFSLHRQNLIVAALNMLNENFQKKYNDAARN